jgi:hypothetical protein
MTALRMVSPAPLTDLEEEVEYWRLRTRAAEADCELERANGNWLLVFGVVIGVVATLALHELAERGWLSW